MYTHSIADRMSTPLNLHLKHVHNIVKLSKPETAPDGGLFLPFSQ